MQCVRALRSLRTVCSFTTALSSSYLLERAPGTHWCVRCLALTSSRSAHAFTSVLPYAKCHAIFTEKLGRILSLTSYLNIYFASALRIHRIMRFACGLISGHFVHPFNFRSKQICYQTVFGALMFVNRVAMIAGGEGKPLMLRHP